MENTTTVLDFGTALSEGYEPRDYAYGKEHAPIGQYSARLDFTLWSKKQTAINCFFTLLPSGDKVSLSAYRNTDGSCLLGDIEVRSLNFGTIFCLTVELNHHGRPKLSGIFPEPETQPDQSTDPA